MKYFFLYFSIISVFVTWIFLNDLNAQVSDSLSSQTVIWAKGIVGVAQGIATDKDGNTYVIGSFQGTINYESFNLISNGFSDIFIAKYDSHGNIIWVKSIGGTGDDVGYGICVNSQSDCFITGKYSQGATLINGGIADVFIAKYDKNGNLIWSKTAGGTGEDVGYAINYDITGNIFITGKFKGNAIFDTIQLSSNNDNIFIAKYDTTGNAIWVKQSQGEVYGQGIASDLNGNCYVTGYYNYSATFSNIQLSSYGGSDFFIVKYNSSGTLIWVKSAGGAVADVGNSISIDKDGNSYVTGYINGSAMFENTPLFNSGSLLVKYDINGNMIWAKKLIEFASGQGITISKNGYMQITGYSDNYIYVGIYDFDGNLISKIKGSQVNGRGISSDSEGNSYITGVLFLGQTAVFGCTSINGNIYNSYISKISSPITSVSDEEKLPLEFKIYQNYPNPFNPSTKIKYVLDKNYLVKVTVHDILGRTIWTLVNKEETAGLHEYIFDAKELSSGIYYYTIKAGQYSQTKKMIILK